MSNLLISDSPITPDDRLVLRAIAELVIPADTGIGIPSAGDEAIFATITGLIQTGSNGAELKRYLDAFTEGARMEYGAEFLALGKSDQIAWLGAPASASLLALMIEYTAHAYYQDGRVLKSLNLKSEPPFPGGHEVPQGDWSLLDPVKSRAPFYRKVSD